MVNFDTCKFHNTTVSIQILNLRRGIVTVELHSAVARYSLTRTQCTVLISIFNQDSMIVPELCCHCMVKVTHRQNELWFRFSSNSVFCRDTENLPLYIYSLTQVPYRRIELMQPLFHLGLCSLNVKNFRTH